MWNKLSGIFLIIGLFFCFDIISQDSVDMASGEIAVDSLYVSSKGVKRIKPGDLSPFRRDSIIRVFPKARSSLVIQRNFDSSLVEKYASDRDLQYERNINKSFFQRLKEIISVWLDRIFGNPDTSNINNLTERILNLLLVLIFLAATYIAVRLLMNHRGRWFFEKKNESVSIDFSNVEQHIHEANFELLLHEAEQNGDTRQAIRLLYLWLLKVFTDKNFIQWNLDKTNVDYLAEIDDKLLKEQFNYLSYLYNYIWYGGFSINDSEYEDARELFLRHIKTEMGNE